MGVRSAMEIFVENAGPAQKPHGRKSSHSIDTFVKALCSASQSSVQRAGRHIVELIEERRPFDGPVFTVFCGLGGIGKLGVFAG